MKKLLLETSFSKIYMIVMIIITLLILGGYFSYAMFTVTKEKSNAVSIVTGNLTYKLEVEENETNTLTVPANSRKDFIVTLSNPNNRIARFNFYYLGDLADGVDIGYIEKDEFNVPPTETGINLEKVDTTGSSNTYIVRVVNTTGSEISIELGVSVGLDYNDLELPENGHLFEEIHYQTVSETLLTSNLGNGSTYDDGVDTFITGENPNNYIWYSGKLWRAVLVNNDTKTTKLVTQWGISSISYDDNSSVFKDSYMEEWLNDITVDGFLGNLRDYENFIVTDAKWNDISENRNIGEITRADNTTVVSSSVGLLNIYEYQSCGSISSYLNNGLSWWTISQYYSTKLNGIDKNGNKNIYSPSDATTVRPSINLKFNVKIVDGDGTIDNPYRLEGDNDTNLSGTLLNTRYSGEYIRFGIGENDLYRIVSHENGEGVKVTSAEPLKNNGVFKQSVLGNVKYSKDTTMGTFLNNDYLIEYIGNKYIEMIEDNTVWYLGTVGSGTSYKLAKYTDTSMTNTTSRTIAKVGLLRLGELMACQFASNESNTAYWTLTAYNASSNRSIYIDGYVDWYNPSSYSFGIRPSLNLKSNVVITGGTGLKNDPFIINLQ